MVHTFFLAMALAASAPDAGPGQGQGIGATAIVKAPEMTPEVKALVDRTQAFYEKTQDFTATFKQDYTNKVFARTMSSTGKVTYAKATGAEPSRMRWDYDKPKGKTFLLNGEKAYFYDPEAATLNVTNVDTSQLSASVTFLWGKGKLEKEFAITKTTCEKCAGVPLELNPLKPDPRFQKVYLEIDPKTATVLKSTVIDPEGNANVIAFNDLKTNTGIGVSKDGGVPEVFRLAPPAGTQVNDLTKH
ncbi:MAG: outer membrane lipoprotein carrier protein LolA [Myxococcaceae bacterium]